MLASGPFAELNKSKFVADGNPHTFKEMVPWPVVAVAFESLNGPGISNHAGGDYEIWSVDVESYRPISLVNLESLTYLVDTSPISKANPDGPIADVRVTNHGTTAIKGPIQMLLEDLTPGLSVVNPDGSYLGTPFVTLSSTTLAPGQSESIQVHLYSNSNASGTPFRPHLVSFGL